MNRTVQFIIGILAIALALAAGFYGRNAYLREVSTYQVPVPVAEIPAYSVLTESMFQLRDMPRTLETLPYFQTLADLKGKISNQPLAAGLPVPNVSAVAAEQFRLAAPVFEVVSIPVDPVSAVGGQVQIGQRVNLYSMMSVETDASQSTTGATPSQKSIQVETIAANVLVVDVRTSQGVKAGPDTGETQANSGTSASNQQTEQVQILTLALEPGSVKQVLDAVATSKKQGGLLWTTMAIP